MTTTTKSPVKATIDYLALCQKARAAGVSVAYTTDPAWLLDMAINRRAGWPDDPSFSRGSAMPVNGRYPKKAEGDRWWHLRRLAHAINSRVVVREGELGEWRKLLTAKLPERFHRPEDD